MWHTLNIGYSKQAIVFCIPSSRHQNTKKLLHYFEQCFVQVAGDDSLLQLDEFKEALGRHLVCCTLVGWGGGGGVVT